MTSSQFWVFAWMSRATLKLTAKAPEKSMVGRRFFPFEARRNLWQLRWRNRGITEGQRWRIYGCAQEVQR